MSYEIIKAIGIKNNEVWITSYSSNITPKIPSRWHADSLTKILVEKGKKEYEKEVLRLYWDGAFQNTDNLFDKSVQWFNRNNPCFVDCWAKVDDVPISVPSGTTKYNTYAELKEKLHEAYLAFKNRKKEKLIIRVMVDRYVTSLGKRSFRYGAIKEYAMIFNSREEAELASDTLKGYKDMEPEILPA